MIRRLSIVAALLSGMATTAFAAEADAQLIRSGRINQAIMQLQERVRSNPADAESLNLLARAYYSVEQWDQAIANNQRALKIAPESSDYHSWMGRAYGEKADTVGIFGAASLARKTKSEFEKAVQLNPSATQARLDLAEYYIEAPGFMGGGVDKARAQAEQTAQFDQAASHLIRARIAQQKKDFQNAELEFKAAIATAKNPSTYWLNLASFYQTRSRFDEMESAVHKAVNLTDRQASVLYDAASILNRAGRDLPDAINFLRRYLEEGHFDEDAPAFRAHYLMGQVYEKMQRRDDAVAAYRTALSMASDFKKAQQALDKLQGRTS